MVPAASSNPSPTDTGSSEVSSSAKSAATVRYVNTGSNEPLRTNSSSEAVAAGADNEPGKSKLAFLPCTLLHTIPDIVLAITRITLNLVWQGHLTAELVKDLDEEAAKTIKKVRGDVSTVFGGLDSAKKTCVGVDLSTKNWHLQVYKTPTDAKKIGTRILLTSPNGACFWILDKLQAQLERFFDSPEKELRRSY